MDLPTVVPYLGENGAGFLNRHSAPRCTPGVLSVISTDFGNLGETIGGRVAHPSSYEQLSHVGRQFFGFGEASRILP